MSTPTVTPADTLLTPGEIAEIANVSRKTVYREIERGTLRVLHAGRQIRIDPHDFRAWLEGGEDRVA